MLHRVVSLEQTVVSEVRTASIIKVMWVVNNALSLNSVGRFEKDARDL
jgi:hypothetical protein